MKSDEQPNITFSGDITVNGPMFDIHDNEHVHIGNPGQSSMRQDQANNETRNEVEEKPHEELFHFIHPSIPEDQEWQIHQEVKRLVVRHGIQEICLYLYQMKKENKILLPQSLIVAYNELIRMGMPKGEGFSEKTFQKYYKK